MKQEQSKDAEGAKLIVREWLATDETDDGQKGETELIDSGSASHLRDEFCSRQFLRLMH